jgi:hypothetical protein
LSGRELLVLPQNETHVESLQALLPAFAARGIAVRVLDLRRIYHQDLELESLGVPVASLDLASRKPFYRSRAPRRAGVVLRAWRRVEAAVDPTDGVLAFNDGAIQRIALRRARNRHGATFVLLDGMISDYRNASKSGSVRGLLQRTGRLLGNTPAAALLPSEVGMAPVDLIFVIGEHSADVLRRRGTRALRIVASGLPRWTDGSYRTPYPSKVRRVLYLTGAFAWHADPETGRAQLADVAVLAQVCRRLGMDLSIRVHPRDDPQPYEGIAPLIAPASESLAASITASDEVISLVSTGLLEAISLGRLARVLCIAPDWRRFESSFAADPILMLVTSQHGLESALAADAREVDTHVETRQLQGLKRFVAADGPEAVERIADTIATRLVSLRR